MSSISIKKKTAKTLQQLIARFVLLAFAFTTFSAPYAQANLWMERKRAVDSVKNQKESQEPKLLASLPASMQTLDSNQILSNLSTPNTQNLSSALPKSVE